MLNCVVVLPIVHCTPEHGSRFVPEMVNMTSGVPAVAVVGEMAVMVGAAGDPAEILKAWVFERAPALETSIFTEPGATISEIGMTAVSCVELTKVVASGNATAGGGLAAHSTIELFAKFVPVTVRETAEALQDGVEAPEVVEADREVTVGARIMNAILLEALLAPGVTTATFAVPIGVKSPAGIVAVS